MPLPYNIGDIATGVFDDEFDSDTGYATVASISGWLEANVGLLNTRLYTTFSGSGNLIQDTGAFSLRKRLYINKYTFSTTTLRRFAPSLEV